MNTVYSMYYYYYYVMLFVNYAIKGHSFAPRIYVHQISIPFISSLVLFRLQTHSYKRPLSSIPLLVQFHSRHKNQSMLIYAR